MMVAGSYGLYQRYMESDMESLFCLKNQSKSKGILPWTMLFNIDIRYVYYLSKFLELADTFILILKKKELIFLHWYHHSVVILLVWSWVQFDFAYGKIK
jgi:fatty acid elongase 3